MPPASDSTATRVEALLEHERSLRPLIRSLVRDADADDVLQETWIRALRRPISGGALASWLRRVAQNLARDRLREDARRRRRETATVPDDSEPSTAETIERLRIQSCVARAVSELAEPYRTAVMLRHLHGLRSAEVAARTGTSESNARQRVSRGLAQLRARLERELGSDWRSTPGILTLIAAPKRGGLVFVALGACMSKPLIAWIGVTAAVVCAAILFSLSADPSSPAATGAEHPGAAELHAAIPRDDGDDAGAAAGTRTEVAAAADDLADLERFNADGEVLAHVRVIDAESRQPVPFAPVAVLPKPFDWYTLTAAQRAQIDRTDDDFTLYSMFGYVTEADANGRLALPMHGKLFLAGEDSGRCGRLHLDAEEWVADDVHDLELHVDRGFRVRVVDPAGRPLPQCRVVVVPHWADDDSRGPAREVASAHTDENGIARIRYVQRWAGLLGESGAATDACEVRPAIVGEVPAGITVDLDALPVEPVTLVAPPCGTVTVHCRDDTGAGVGPGDNVRLERLDRDDAADGGIYLWSGEPAARGTTLFRYVRSGARFRVRASMDDEVSVEPIEIVGPPPGETETVVLRVQPGAVTIVGRLVDSDGDPVARIRARLRYHVGDDLNATVPFTSDTDGRFRFDLGGELIGAEVARARIIQVTQHETGARMAKFSLPAPISRGRHDLGEVLFEPAPLIVGGEVLIDGQPATIRPTIEVRRYEPAEDAWYWLTVTSIRWTRAGRFEVRGLTAPGRYRITAEAKGCLPSQPLEFSHGRSDVVIDLREGAAFAANVDGDAALLESVGATLVRADGAPIPAETKRVGARLSALWRGLEAGPYTLEVRLAGHSEPLHRVPLVVAEGERPADDRLRLTLDGVFERFVVQARAPGYRGEVPGAVWVGDVAADSTPSPIALRNGRAVVWASRIGDLHVAVQGYAPVRALVAAGANRAEARLEPAPTMRFVVAPTPRLPAGVALELRVERPRTDDPMRRFRVPNRVELALVHGGVDLPVIAGEELRVRLAVSGEGTAAPIGEFRTVRAEVGETVRLDAPAAAIRDAVEFVQKRR